jgi:hypothetical protein
MTTDAAVATGSESRLSWSIIGVASDAAFSSSNTLTPSKPSSAAVEAQQSSSSSSSTGVQAIVIRGVSAQIISLIQQSDDVEAAFPDLKVRVPDGMAPATMDLMSISAGEQACVVPCSRVCCSSRVATSSSLTLAENHNVLFTVDYAELIPAAAAAAAAAAHNALKLHIANDHLLSSVACSTALRQRPRNQCRHRQQDSSSGKHGMACCSRRLRNQHIRSVCRAALRQQVQSTGVQSHLCHQRSNKADKEGQGPRVFAVSAADRQSTVVRLLRGHPKGSV